MAMDINSLLERYRFSTMLIKIIVVNVAIFTLLHLASIILMFAGDSNPGATVMQWVGMPSNPAGLLAHFWTPVTYMFAQYDVFHILFNMLWLYWFGVIFLSLSTGRRMLALYCYGGILGAALYLLAYNTLPFFAGSNGLLIGSSGAVIAIVAATAIMVPDYKMYLLFLGGVSLKWVAIVTIGLDLIGVTGANAGGHIAHLGGAVAGALYALMLRRGVDITVPFCRVADSVVNACSTLTRRRAPRVKFTRYKASQSRPASSPARSRTASTSAEDQAMLDSILDKIKKSGYSSLTPDERRRLFDVSNRIK